MAIAFDVATVSSADTNTSITFAHTCTGSNRALVVGVTGDTSANDVNSVTYAGTAMTKVNTIQVASNRYINIWYLENPASGANNVVVTADSSHYLQAIAMSYTGCKQSGGRDSTATNTGSSVTSLTVSTTTVADNSWLVMVGKGNLYWADAGANTTSRVATGTTQGFDSNAAKTPAGSFGLIATSSSQNMAFCILSIAPYVATSAIKSVSGVAYASLKKVSSVAIASVKKVAGLT